VARSPFSDAFAAGKKSGVVVLGLDETKRQMRMFAPDLLKEMNFEIRREILGPIVKDARDMVPEDAPLSGWNRRVTAPGSRRSYTVHGKRWEYGRLAWDHKKVRTGIRVGVGVPRRRGDVFRGAYAILNRDPAGAVFELMGRGNSRANMVGNVRRHHGPASRLIWKAWDKANSNTNVPKKVVDTIKRFEAQFQERLDTRGRSF
jgi:hypothetical protein